MTPPTPDTTPPTGHNYTSLGGTKPAFEDIATPGVPYPHITIIPRSYSILREKIEPGTWRTINGQTQVRCPKCHRFARLTDHIIADDGEVIPSIRCPYQAAGCIWHVRAYLAEWQPHKDGDTRT